MMGNAAHPLANINVCSEAFSAPLQQKTLHYIFTLLVSIDLCPFCPGSGTRMMHRCFELYLEKKHVTRALIAELFSLPIRGKNWIPHTSVHIPPKAGDSNFKIFIIFFSFHPSNKLCWGDWTPTVVCLTLSERAEHLVLTVTSVILEIFSRRGIGEGFSTVKNYLKFRVLMDEQKKNMGYLFIPDVGSWMLDL